MMVYLNSKKIPNKLILKEGTVTVADGLFNFCTNLTDITIPNSVRSIGEYVFFWSEGLKSITIPEAVTEIGKSTFSSFCPGAGGGCTSLESITILGAVTKIGTYAFADCTSLKSVTIPESVTEIGYGAFKGCTSLTSIVFQGKAPSIGEDAFSETPWYSNQADGLVYVGKVAYKYKGTMPSGTQITIKDGIVSIGEGAFSGCTGLTEITCLATDISADGCVNNWLDDVADEGTFTKAVDMEDWPTGTSGIPSGWTVQNQ